MTTHTTAIDHPTRWLVVALPSSYDAARKHYESLGPVDSARFFQMASWQATLELAEINAPYGFMRYYRSDITAAMAGSPSFWKATQYLMGNHTIAERMFRHDPSVMLHAPLRTLLYADPDGDTKLAVDQHSLLFASYDNPQVADVGHELDALLAQLITLLGGEARAQLAGRHHANALRLCNAEDAPILMTGAGGGVGSVGRKVVTLLRERHLPVRATVHRDLAAPEALLSLSL